MCRICTSFNDALAVKISWDLLKGLWRYGDFELMGSGYPIFLAPLSGETMRQTPKVLEVQEVLYHRAKFGGARISPAVGAVKNVEFFGLSVRHAFGRQEIVRPISP